MRRVMLIGLAAGGLGACALPTERVGGDLRWGLFEVPDEGSKLVLGVPETDDVRLVMVCSPRSGRVEITVIGKTGDPAAVELRSGKLSHVYAGAGQADDEMEGAVDIELKAPVTDPVLARLADTGELSVIFPTRRIVLPNAFAEAHDFLNRCRAP